MRTPVVGLVLCLGLGACAQSDAPVPSEAPMVISQAVWNAYESYRRLESPGAFAVAADGWHAGYAYCVDDGCRHGFVQVGRTAVSACEESGGTGCRVFAEGTRIVTPYRVE
jgi:hypothetical protein